ncbi:hypothetical protein Tco_1227861 [Tanacetum coccineum]
MGYRCLQQREQGASFPDIKRQKASDFELNPDPAPELQNLFLSKADTAVPLTTGVGSSLWSFVSMNIFNDGLLVVKTMGIQCLHNFNQPQKFCNNGDIRSPINSSSLENPSNQCKQVDQLANPIPVHVIVRITNKVYRLRKALYGLKQAPRAWGEGKEILFRTSDPPIHTKISSKTTGNNLKRGLKDLSLLTEVTIHIGTLVFRRVLALINSFFRCRSCRCLSLILRKSSSGGIQFPSCAQVMLDGTASRFWPSTYIKILVCIAFSVSYSNLMQPRAALPYQAYPYSECLIKALPEERFQYLIRRIGMRCLTTAELEVLTKESA